MRVLDRHIEDIDKEWKRLLRESKMTNANLVNAMPKLIRERLREYGRKQLDEELVAERSTKNWCKDTLHSMGQQSHDKTKAPVSPVLNPTAPSDPEDHAPGSPVLQALRGRQRERTLEAVEPTVQRTQQGSVGGAAASMGGTATTGGATAGDAIETLEEGFANAVGDTSETSSAILTLADVAARGPPGVTVDDLHGYSEDDMRELLKDELRLKVHVRNKILKEWRTRSTE
jgi:hypothetical protein